LNGNAKIDSTHLGYEDHGILTCWLHLSQDGSAQGFGGWSIQPNAGFWIKRILDTVGVDSWDKLPGKHVRVDGTHRSIEGIGHIVSDKWFYPRKEIKDE
jgi:hypothetical protein